MHDIEFVTDISTSLLVQMRQLQAVLAERDESLKAVQLEKSRLELEAQGFAQRLRSLDESEQRYKDENWSLELQTHEMIAAAKEAADREQRLQQSLALQTSEKTAAQRELDDLKQSSIKLNEEFAMFRRNHDSELTSLRKAMAAADIEKVNFQRRIDELSAQNLELAKAVAGQSRSADEPSMRDLGSEPEEFSLDRSEPEHSPPPSPSKGALRHTALESETLKSSLNHAHRMIQSLKGNLHREKTDKLELKRMLQESRDELEMRRNEMNGSSNGNKRLKKKSQPDLGKKGRPSALGLARNSRTDVEVDDGGWEDHDGEKTPSYAPRIGALIKASELANKHTDTSDAYQTANDTEDAFETANERETATETEAFQTGAESMAGDSSDNLTETEAPTARSSTARGSTRLSMAPPKALGRSSSYISTASTSASDEDYDPKTPSQTQPQRYRLKVNRNSRRSRLGSEPPPDGTPGSMKDSPASFVSTAGQNGRQSLFAELGDINDPDSGDELVDTPSKASVMSHRSATGSRPSTAKQNASPQTTEPPMPQSSMIDSSMMTDSGPKTPQMRDAASQRTPVTTGNQVTASISTDTPPKLAWDQPTKDFAGIIPTFRSGFVSGAGKEPKPEHRSDPNYSRYPIDEPESDVSGYEGQVESPFDEDRAVSPLSFSEIQSLETAPAEPPVIPARNTKRLSTISTDLTNPPIAQEPQQDSHHELHQEPHQEPQEASKGGMLEGGILGSVLGWTRSKRQSISQGAQDTSRNVSGLLNESERRAIEKSDHGSQTILSAEQIDNLLSQKSVQPLAVTTDNIQKLGSSNMKPLSDIGAVSPPLKSADRLQLHVREPSKASIKTVDTVREAAPLIKSLKRPGSSNSVRTATPGTYPPLPPDHRQAIAAAQQAPTTPATSGVMGPPLAPASAYRNSSARSRTPSEVRLQSPMSQNGNTPRARYSSIRSRMSRRSSVSSFESELDARFNIRPDGMPMPQGLDSGTDPRMIQAITQTMIGEYLWKYTRKAGRGEMSDNRHRRFFWVHPYTRTLYWSESDPSTAGRAQMKAKSVAIDAIRVVTDDNPFPPGLHRKSLVIITPGRVIKFTATTAQRHETWFNALSYLLLRTGPEASLYDPNGMTADEVAEFNPSYKQRRGTAGSTMRGAGSRVSLSSYNSHPPTRNASRSGSRDGTFTGTAGSSTAVASGTRTTSRDRAGSSMSNDRPGTATRTNNRVSDMSFQQQQQMNAANAAAASMTTNPTSGQQTGSVASRLSSYWRPISKNKSIRGSVGSQKSLASVAGGQQGAGSAAGGGNGSIYNASVVGGGDSAEDLRQVYERQDEEAGRLENVRACCDGKLAQFISVTGLSDCGLTSSCLQVATM